jgi:hypothetical protein
MARILFLSLRKIIQFIFFLSSLCIIDVITFSKVLVFFQYNAQLISFIQSICYYIVLSINSGNFNIQIILPDKTPTTINNFIYQVTINFRVFILQINNGTH